MFEVTEIFEASQLQSLNEQVHFKRGNAEVEITSFVDELVFNGIKITLGGDGFSLVLEVVDDKRNRVNKALTIAPPSKGKPSDPAGKPVPPKIIIRP